MLTDDELADLRAEMLNLLPSTCDIQRLSTTVDDYGNTAETWTTVENDIACRVDPLNLKDSKGMVAMGESNRVYYQLTFPYDADVLNGDRITYGSNTIELLNVYATHSLNAVCRATGAQIA